MTDRGRGWIASAGLTGLVVAATLAEPSSRPLAIPVGLLTLCLFAMASELLGFVLGARASRNGSAPHDPTPADGSVDILPLPGLLGRDNREDPRWRRFGSLDNSDVPSKPGGPRREPAPDLLGRVAIFSIFVGADGRGWTDAEIARGLGAIERAGGWLERQAIRHGAPVQIGLSSAYFQAEAPAAGPIELSFRGEGDDIGPMEADPGTKYLAMASQAAAGLGFRDVGDLMTQVGDRAEADRRAWLLHVRQAGRSIAIPTRESGIDGVSLAVCFAREASFPEPLVGPGRVDPTTVVHELLHLFGASDKYGQSLGSFPPGTVSSSEVMRLDQDWLRRLRIDRLTASEIGWIRSTGGNQRKTRRRPR